jgi:hypothetical protein
MSDVSAEIPRKVVDFRWLIGARPVMPSCDGAGGHDRMIAGAERMATRAKNVISSFIMVHLAGAALKLVIRGGESPAAAVANIDTQSGVKLGMYL